MNMYNILYISPTIPCLSIPHAGGQLAFYYLSKLNNRRDVCLKIINLPPQKEEIYFREAADLFDLTCCYRKDRGFLKKILTKLDVRTAGFIPIDTYVAFKNKIKELKSAGYVPDYVIFDWEQMSYLYKTVHSIWSDAYYSAIEQDVLYQSLARFLHSEKNFLRKLNYFFSYRRCLHAEKRVFPCLNEVVVLSEKDQSLVHKISPQIKSRVISPYYHDYGIEEKSEISNEIVFYGSLSRQENYEAVEWFIKNVMPCLNKDIRFIVIGGECPKNIKEYSANNIIFTGFLPIEDIKKIFSRAICMVVPLLHGAGVKIKVLEAMSAGLPVLTNEIGIEGIPARKGLEYMHCEYVEDYVQNISCLADNVVLRSSIRKAAKEMIKKSFNYTKCQYIII